MKKETVYIVVSRDTDFLYCTTDLKKAEEAKKKQTKDEEMGGGRPSVDIKKSILNR